MKKLMTATASRVLLLAAAAITGIGAHAGGQTLAQRIARAPDGTIRLAFASRDGVCGNGRDVVRIGNQIYVGSSTTFFMGRGSFDARGERECLTGDVHVTLTKSRGEIVGVKTIIAREARATDGTNLGMVSAPEAAKYFLTLAPLTEDRANKQAVLPAVLADSAVIWPDLLRIANNPKYSLKLRSRMLHWVGMTGDEGAVGPLDAILRDEDAPADLLDAALGALADLPDDLGLPSLTRIATGSGSISLRKKAVFWLGQSDDASARRVVLTLVKNEDTPEEVRADGIFALSQNGEPDDLRELRALYPSLRTKKLREKVIMGASQSGDEESLRWILAIALNEKESFEVRKQALFWAGQGGTDIKELLGLWTRIEDPDLREHLLFVYSQRDDSEAAAKLIDVAKSDDESIAVRKKALFWAGQGRADIRQLVALWSQFTEPEMRDQLVFVYSQRRESQATDKLIAIAKSDPSREIRKKAMFWLGQRDDPRAAKFIREVLNP